MTEVKIPSRSDLMNPVFQALKSLGGSGTIEEINNKASEIARLSDDQLEVLHNPKRGGQTEVEYRLVWTRTYLKKYGVLDNSGRGVWALTPEGRQLDRVDPRTVMRSVREKMEPDCAVSAERGFGEADEKKSLRAKENESWRKVLSELRRYVIDGRQRLKETQKSLQDAKLQAESYRHSINAIEERLSGEVPDLRYRLKQFEQMKTELSMINKQVEIALASMETAQATFRQQWLRERQKPAGILQDLQIQLSKRPSAKEATELLDRVLWELEDDPYSFGLRQFSLVGNGGLLENWGRFANWISGTGSVSSQRRAVLRSCIDNFKSWLDAEEKWDRIEQQYLAVKDESIPDLRDRLDLLQLETKNEILKNDLDRAHAGAGERRELIPDAVKMFVWKRDGGKCVKCGSQENLEFDHIIPLAMGGSSTARNIQLLCETCNRSKGGNLA